MNKAFSDLLILIKKLAGKNGDQVEIQYQRLREFEERNIEDPDNS